MQRVGLTTKFFVLFILTAAVLLAVNTAWRSTSQSQQVEREMLESAQMLATSMDAVWDFMELNQKQFIKNADGTYNVYCVVAAKVIARRITNASDGTIVRYTNVEPRRITDAPDDFELEALLALQEDPGLGFYYGIEDYGEGRAFRYVEPLYLSESCLECHGEPAGELDVMGYAKEGLAEGDLAGAVSIIIPATTYLESASENSMRETTVFALLMVCCLSVIALGISVLVTKPLTKLGEAAEKLGRHEFDVELEGVGNRDEVEELARSLQATVVELERLYDHLETEVQARTCQIAESNQMLERQRAELETLNAILQRDNALKEDFLATMSHEMRTPLTSILAFADLWEQMDAPRSPKERRILSEMRFSSQVLLSMVNNMLDLSRMAAGHTEVIPQVTDVADLLGSVRHGISFMAEKKGVAVRVSTIGEVPVVLADREKLYRVLENLVSNAVKYVEPGGNVGLVARYREDPTRGEAMYGMLELQVCDDGCGIDPADVPHLFERFVRGASSQGGPGRCYGSSGLGLSLVKEMTELMGGTVRVDSKVGVGSTFTVEVPVETVDFDELLGDD